MSDLVLVPNLLVSLCHVREAGACKKAMFRYHTEGFPINTLAGALFPGNILPEQVFVHQKRTGGVCLTEKKITLIQY